MLTEKSLAVWKILHKLPSNTYLNIFCSVFYCIIEQKSDFISKNICQMYFELRVKSLTLSHMTSFWLSPTRKTAWNSSSISSNTRKTFVTRKDMLTKWNLIWLIHSNGEDYIPQYLPSHWSSSSSIDSIYFSWL